MLSRVAERIYWMARYVERAENTARLISVYTHLWLDLPSRIRLGWLPLLDITETRKLYNEQHFAVDEHQIVQFLLTDTHNPSSILSSLSWARENMRTIRDIASTEAWEEVNELYLYAKSLTHVFAHERYQVLNRIIAHCQRIQGLLAGTMDHDETYDFVRLGSNLERADMTTRILDAGALNVLSDIESDARQEYGPFNKIQWMSILKSLDAYHTFRRHVHPRVSERSAVSYVLQNETFPRTVVFCLGEMLSCLSRLPQGGKIEKKVTDLRISLLNTDISDLLSDDHDQMHNFIDKMQIQLGEIHSDIRHTWFGMN